jgi:hypothetical protein
MGRARIGSLWTQLFRKLRHDRSRAGGPIGLDRQPPDGDGFYAIIAFATLIGAGIDFTPIHPIRALIWADVLNGVTAVPIMGMIMRMAVRPNITSTFVITRRLRRLGDCDELMVLAAAAMFVSRRLGPRRGQRTRRPARRAIGPSD